MKELREMNGGLHEECDFLLKNFDARQQGRQAVRLKRLKGGTVSSKATYDVRLPFLSWYCPGMSMRSVGNPWLLEM